MKTGKAETTAIACLVATALGTAATATAKPGGSPPTPPSRPAPPPARLTVGDGVFVLPARRVVTWTVTKGGMAKLYGRGQRDVSYHARFVVRRAP